jgi:uncharacterized coiled-coil protein SlyX
LAEKDTTITERNVIIAERGKAIAEKQTTLSLLASKNQELQSQLVRNLIERGAAQSEAGRCSQAVALFAGAYKMARPDDPLRTSARNLAAGWAANVGSCTLMHDSQVNAVAFSPDGRTVLTGSSDQTARLWDAATGKPIGEPLRHDGSVSAVAFSPDGRTVLTGSGFRTARLWDAATGKASRCAMNLRSRPWPSAPTAARSSPGATTRPRAFGTPRRENRSASR